MSASSFTAPNHGSVVSKCNVSRRAALGLALAGSVAVAPWNKANAAETLTLSGGKITAGANSVRDSNQLWRKTFSLAAQQVTSSWDALPFHQFEVPVTAGATSVDLAWKGTANAGARVRLMVHNYTTHSLTEAAFGFADAQGNVSLNATVKLEGIVSGGKVLVIIQHSQGYSGTNRSFRSTPVTPEHAGDTPRSQYDFTLAWESDTQYYNESYPQRQIDVHDYFLRQRDPMNIQYMFHTGDIVDEYDKPIQWERANTAYTMLDRAGLPYGVLGGNHDVGQYDEKGFPVYTQNFGDWRFAKNPWFGGSHKNNRGHYDLVSAGTHDFLMVYMSWSAKDAEIAWMNQVLARYPERVAIIALHEFLDTEGKLAALPQRIKDEVIAKNRNVRLVLSGHHHGAMKNQHFFDDDGDGVAERVVTNVLFDPQGLPEGGQSFLRLMHFDNYNGKMISRTYSPYLKKFDSDSPALPKQHQEFTVSYKDLGLKMAKKRLMTASFTAQMR